MAHDFRPGHFAVVTTLPTCDICRAEGYDPPRTARYDFRTIDGRWANGCGSHYRAHRMYTTLGVGMGQRLYIQQEIPPRAGV